MRPVGLAYVQRRYHVSTGSSGVLSGERLVCPQDYIFRRLLGLLINDELGKKIRQHKKTQKESPRS